MMHGSIPNHEVMASLMLLTTWKVWNERNIQVFHIMLAAPSIILDKIKRDICFLGKCLDEMMTEEQD
jgi:hypothetical protein